MKYVSIDLETTGLDRENDQVLSIGAIIEDTNLKLPYEELPKFYGIILHDRITGSPFAISLNKDLIEMMCAYKEGNKEVKGIMEQRYGKIFYQEEDIIPDLYRFLHKNGLGNYSVSDVAVQRDLIDGVYYPQINGKTKPITINVAGKNFGTFDKPFLSKLPWFQKLIIVRQRIIDPANSYVDWANDETLPSLNDCKKRAGISGEVSHNALEDAWDVIQVLRGFY